MSIQPTTTRRGRTSSRRRLSAVLAAATTVVAAALIPLITGPAATADAPGGLHVAGNRLLDATGRQVVLRGVDRSGSEYACIQGFGFFDGPSDAASIAAMAAWHINTVRVPLNEDCWLGINNAPAAYSGSAYQAAIGGYVSRLHAAGLIAVLDLHWTAAGGNQSTGQQNMPDADHAPAFWTSVANTFKSDGSTVFDLFNEPHDVSWSCWRDGGDCGIGYQVAGMQSLVTAVRSTGAANPLLVGGLAYANDLSSWLNYRPSDPGNGIMASWHSYNFNACSTSSCWDSQIAPVAAQVPLVTGEIGENDCAHGYLDNLLPWLDAHAAGYLGWGWDTFDCASFPALISSYDGTPTGFGIGLRDHLAALAAGSGSSSSPGTTATTSPAASTTTSRTTPTASTTRTTATSATSTGTSRTTTSAPSSTRTSTTTRTSSSTAGGGSLTASASANTASAPWWWEEDLSVTPSAPVTALSVTVTVARTGGVSYSGFYSTAPGGVLALSETTGASSLVYQATLTSGQTLAGGTAVQFGIQFSGTGSPHPTSGDTYRISATVNGAAITATGTF